MNKKQRLMTIVLLISLSILISVICIYKGHRQKFEMRVQELYGTENYLGPMKKTVEKLTEKEVEEFKSECGFFYYSFYEKNENYNEYEYQAEGRCNRQKIEDIYDARDTAYSLITYLGIRCDRDTFLYGEKLEDSYRFYQYYKGVRVNYGKIYVEVDESGNTEFISIQLKAPEDIKVNSVTPKFTKEKLLAYMDENYGMYEIEECRLCLDMDEKEWSKNTIAKWNLVWEVDVYSEDSLVYCIVFDAYTGEETDTFFACDA